MWVLWNVEGGLMINFKNLCLIAIASFITFGCGGGGGISTKPTQDAFEKDMNFNPKMDILWVVDPSRSMRDEIEKVKENINEFVEEFIASEYQYRMGVISTAAWSDDDYNAESSSPAYLYDNSEEEAFKPLFARLHRGECVDPNYQNNEAILDYLTASDVATFMKKFNTIFDVFGTKLNTFQCGLNHLTNYDAVPGNIFSNQTKYPQATRQTLATTYMLEEKPLQSLRAFLRRDHALPASDPNKFMREDAYLAVIIITDEPDSSDGDATSYVEYLKSIKNPAGDDSFSRFGIYSIVKTDMANHKSAEASLLTAGLSLPLTGCQVAARCFDIDADSYKESLNTIKSSILVEATNYPLSRPPILSSIVVKIKKEDGSEITLNYDANNPKWYYDEATQSISFHEDYLPTPKDEISVDYTPKTLGAGGQIAQAFLDLDGNSIDEGSPAGTEIGQVIIANNTTLVGDRNFEIIGSNTGGFVIDAQTGKLSSGATVLDSDVRARHEVHVKLTVTREDTEEGQPPILVGELDRVFLIRVNDIPDSDPDAKDIEVEVSVTSADPVTGKITVSRNVAYEADGMDTSEEHTFAVTQNPSKGQAAFSATTAGLLVFEIDESLVDMNGENITFKYTITGTECGSNPCQPSEANMTVKINRENSPPELIQHLGCDGGSACPDPEITIGESTEGPYEVVFNASDVVASCIAAGSVSDLLNADVNQGLRTCTGRGNESGQTYTGAPFIELNFPIDKPYFEVREFRVQGRHSLGNAILQVRSDDNRVIDREVIGVSEGTGSITRGLQRPIIGRKIRILRPQGSVNPSNHQYLDLGKITAFGVKAVVNDFDLDEYFNDPDFGKGDTLTYTLTGETEEHPAPSWASLVNGHILRLMPPPGVVDRIIRIEVRDSLGAELAGGAYVFKVSRQGSGDYQNANPISLLALDDAKRGGITLKRFGGGPANSGNHQLDNMIRHGEGDNFLTNPYAGQAIRDALTAGGMTDLRQSTYRCTAPYDCIPPAVYTSLMNSGHADQLAHFGDNYDSWPENGWSIIPVREFDKYPLGASGYCTQSATPNGRITPCINGTRSYGETYTGYFVPAKTGVYRFRSASQVDDLVRLLLAPSEYVEDLTPVITSHHTGVQNLADSLYQALNDNYVANGEFSPNSHPAGGHDTSVFYNGPVVNDQNSYRKGYVYLKQGNVYALEIRFQEGGGDVQFSFEYDRKDADCNPTNSSPEGSCWDGWAAIDASVLVPTDGTDAHEPAVINSFPFDMSKLFYDPEDDAIEYTARLVNPDGSLYSNDISDIGLSIGTSAGNRHLLDGALNQDFLDIPESDRPRIVIKAKEVAKTESDAVESLPIKLQP